MPCTNNIKSFICNYWCSQHEHCKQRRLWDAWEERSKLFKLWSASSTLLWIFIGKQHWFHLMWSCIHDRPTLIAFLSMTTTRWSAHEPDRYMYIALSSIFLWFKKRWVCGWIIYCEGHWYWSSSPHEYMPSKMGAHNIVNRWNSDVCWVQSE